jgi:hypothetical protein
MVVTVKETAAARRPTRHAGTKPTCYSEEPVETATKLITEIGKDLERLKWLLWHGNVFRALQTVQDITANLETLHPDGEPTKLLKAVREFDSYLRANAGRIPNYGERRRAGEAISTAFVESTVNQVISMVKKQQMRWSPQGAHLFLQVRTRVLNDQLAGDFRRLVPRLHTNSGYRSARRVASPKMCRSPRWRQIGRQRGWCRWV